MNVHSVAATSAADFYEADANLCIAAEVALELGLPLLLTGEPGTGKTTFAQYLASKLAPEWFNEREPGFAAAPLPLYAFATKSTSVASDLFYRFDSLRRFHDSHDASIRRQNREYISFEALGQAIVFSNPLGEVADLLIDPTMHSGAGRAVVLIDEIDKAPRDFPNDILNEIDRLFFNIPELQEAGSQRVRQIKANPALRPLIVLTSNSEKNLPAAFLRRCVFHHIEFPDYVLLKKIIARNLGRASGLLAEDALKFFLDVRAANLDKSPSTAELVQWIALLQNRTWRGAHIDPLVSLLTDLPQTELQATLGVLAKTAMDLKKVQRLLQQRFAT